MLFAFAEGLELAGRPVSEFRLPIFYLACDRERGEEPGFLATLTMRGALKSAAHEGSLLDRLEAAREPFWRAVAYALVVLAGGEVHGPSLRE
jgi:hypothetical protein